MKIRTLIGQLVGNLTAAALAMAIAGGAQAAQPTGVELSDAVVLTAEVVGVDKADRIVTLVGPRGNVVKSKVDPAASAFDGLKVGDSIVTAGGIHGKIASVQDGSVTVEIATGVKIKMNRSSVTEVSGEG